jgi:sterol desaturase/sphingolipid hydroxylase (fatty acid hydroxylase superfamily)
MENINNRGTASLFKQPLIEKLSRSNPLFIWTGYLLLITLMPIVAGRQLPFILTGRGLAYFLLAFFSWTLFEYIVHRFVFHYSPTSAFGKKLIYIFHENHHHFPKDRKRLVMPLVPSLLIASILFVLLYGIAGSWVFIVFPGFVSGYVIYSMMHFAIHAYNPPFRFLKPLWRNHLLHHYKHANKGFGVSTTLWDRIFNSMYSKEKN